MARICLISDLHLVSNPRLWKEANSLAKAGYEVTILTVWTSASRRDQDFSLLQHPGIRYEAAVNLISGEGNPLLRFYRRLRRRIAVECKRFFKLDSAWLLGYSPCRLTHAALREKADLYICHAEMGMLIGKRLIEKNCKVAFDIEDWYSHDYLVPARPVKLLKELEAFALRYGVYCSCPSQSMANALVTYHGHGKVNAIYNSFSTTESQENADASTAKPRSLIWFSQTVGEGRGLETISRALDLVNEPMELHLLGDCVADFKRKFTERFPFHKGHQLFFHEPVSHGALIKFLSAFEIGLALEKDYPESRNTTITNKVLQYIQAGIKVMATNTKGQEELANMLQGNLVLVRQDDPPGWASALITLNQTHQKKENQLSVFAKSLSWEAQEKKLLSLVREALLN